MSELAAFVGNDADASYYKVEPSINVWKKPF
jgi:hypothetical protein